MPPEQLKPVGRLHAAWIWFWYWDVSRLLFVLFPGHFLLTLPVMVWLHWDGQLIKDVLIGTYLLVLAVAIVYNDFENLRRIGLDPYRRALPESESTQER